MHPDSRLKKQHKIGPVAMISVRACQASSEEKRAQFFTG